MQKDFSSETILCDLCLAYDFAFLLELWIPSWVPVLLSLLPLEWKLSVNACGLNNIASEVGENSPYISELKLHFKHEFPVSKSASTTHAHMVHLTYRNIKFQADCC